MTAFKLFILFLALSAYIPCVIVFYKYLTYGNKDKLYKTISFIYSLIISPAAICYIFCGEIAEIQLEREEELNEELNE